jgi:hypothetical protein
MPNSNVKNISSLVHLSTFARFIFPFGNFVAPIIIWSINKDKSSFIDNHGKAIINFQLSLLIYTFFLALISVPLLVFGVFNRFHILSDSGINQFNIDFSEPSTLLYFGGVIGGFAIIGFVLELLLIILASLKAREGELYNYPLTIKFIK